MSKFKAQHSCTVSPSLCSAWAKQKWCPRAHMEGACFCQAKPPVQVQMLLWAGAKLGCWQTTSGKPSGSCFELLLPQASHPTLSLGISASSAPELPPCKPTGPALALEGRHSLQSCCSMPELWARGVSVESPHLQQPGGADCWEKSLVCDCKIHQCPFHHWWVFTASMHAHSRQQPGPTAVSEF